MLFWRLIGTATLLFCFCAGGVNAVSFGPFGPNGEGGAVNGQLLEVGPHGTVSEIDAFVGVGSVVSQLSKDPVPEVLRFTFSAALSSDATDLRLSYAFKNVSPRAVEDVSFVSFLDPEIDELVNGFANEYATVTGAADTGQSYQVDEPGFLSGALPRGAFGDSLSGANAIPESNPDDVSVAFSFHVQSLDLGEILTVEILLSEDDESLGGVAITHEDSDPDATTTITYSASATISGGPPDCSVEPDGTYCKDGDLCTFPDVCTNGGCLGIPIDCNDGSPCTADSCEAGVCLNVPTPGASCPDDGNVCTDDVCDAEAECLHPANTSPCDDGDACTVGDTCREAVCESGDPRNCNDVNVCTDDSCDSSTGCVNVPNVASCDDADSCTETDLCDGSTGTCLGLDPVVCTPLDQCHVAGECDPASGVCSDPNKPNEVPCDDGDACTVGDVCRDGVCVNDGAALIVEKTCRISKPPPTGEQCDGGVLSMTFEYTGDSCAATTNLQEGKVKCNGDPAGAELVRLVVMKEEDKFEVSPSGEVLSVGSTVAISGTDGRKFKANTKFEIRQGDTALQSLEIHTSCSKALRVGDQFGSLRVVELTSKNGGTVRLYPPPTPTPSCEVESTPLPHCEGKVTLLKFRYLGGDCSTISNDQLGKAKCTGDAGTSEPVRIAIVEDPHDKGGKKKGKAGEADEVLVVAPSDESIARGDLFTIASRDGTFKSSSKFEVRQGETVLQSLEIHTSCSKPLNAGDRFGSVELLALETTDGGLASKGGDIEYLYSVSNRSAANVTNVSLLDNVLGPVPGSPVPVLLAHDTVTFATSEFISEDVTNLVTATGYIEGTSCQATDSSTVSVVYPPEPPTNPPPQPADECDPDHAIAAISFRYTGAGCLASDNQQGEKTTCTGAAAFSEPVRILIRDDHDTNLVYAEEATVVLNATVTSAAANAGRNEFKARISVLIFNSGGDLIETDVIHTSCSEPLGVGEGYGSLRVATLGLVPK